MTLKRLLMQGIAAASSVVTALALLFTLVAAGTAQGQITVRPFERTTAEGPVRGWVAVVDTSHPAVSVHVTAPLDRSRPTTRPYAPNVDARLIATDRWAEELNLTLAINANFFAWIRPETDDVVGGADTIGLSVSDGVVVSPLREHNGQPDPGIVFLEDKTPQVIGPGQPKVDLRRVRHAVAGIGGGERDNTPGTLLVQGGTNLGATARVAPQQRHPRTAIGVGRNGRDVILLVVDGRQPYWSVGMTLPELADAMIELGAVDAVNLDGGGSTTLVYRPPDGSEKVMNRPSDRATPETPGVVRPVANHLGFRLEHGSMPGRVNGSAGGAGSAR